MASYSCYCLLFLITIISIHTADGFGDGAPVSTCFTQYPKHHDRATQSNTTSTISFKFTPSSYQPGQEVEIEVTDTTGERFKGIQIAARRKTGNDDVIVGRFVAFPTNKIKAFNCFGGYQNMLTHSNDHKVHKLTFKWKSDENVGDVVFVTTLLRKFKVFWVGLRADLPVASTSPVKAVKYPTIPMSPQTSSIFFDDCGKTKGCLYYPRLCSGSDCIAAATYQYRPVSKDFLFELHTTRPADYISIGFSHDQWMGNDVTMSCTGRKEDMSVQEGYNPGKYNERHLDIFSSEHEVRYQDGKLQCRFVVPEQFDMYKVVQNPSAAQVKETLWKLKKGGGYYLLLAWGHAMPDSTVMSHHHEYPAISLSEVDLTEKVITYGSAFQLLVRAHGSMMMVAWILVTGIVTVVARHYRQWLPRTRWFGTNVWFQIHRGLAITVFVFTVIGITLIFSNYGPKVNKHAIKHGAVGLTVLACVCLQLIAGIMRPGGDHKRRPLFNWGHWALGHLTHIMSVVTMFLAYDIKFITPDLRQMGFIVLGVWIVVDIIWQIIFEVVKYRKQIAAMTNLERVGDNQFKIAGEDGVKSGVGDVILLSLYVFTLAGLCVAAMVVFLIY